MANNRRVVLHLDEDERFLSSISSELRDEGYEVVSLADASRTCSEVIAQECRVVILNIKLATADGLSLIRAIKEENASVQIIVLTDLVSMSVVLESMRCGAEACFFKPLNDCSELKATLEDSFTKVERWWRTLSEWRQHSTNRSCTALHGAS